MVTKDNFCRIGGKIWIVRIVAIERSYNRVDSENAGRSMSLGAPMILDPLGTFHGHSVTFARSGSNFDEYDALYNFVSFPTKTGIDIEIVFGQSTISYKAYSGTGKQGLVTIGKDGRVYWDTFQCNFIPIKAQVFP